MSQHAAVTEQPGIDGRRFLERDSLREAAGKFFGFPTPWILASTALVGWIGRFVVGGWNLWDALIPAMILLFWPMQEWLIHVLILHFKPVELFGRRFDLHLARKHREHHRDPWRVDDVFIPMRSLLIVLPVGIATWFVVAPQLRVFFMGLAAYGSLSLAYEWTHFLIHVNYKPRTRLYRRLWQNHRLHHFKNEHYWFGVTMLSGDRLLGTAPELGEVDTSETCRTLGVEPD